MSDSAFSQGAEASIEQEYREYQRRCASFHLVSPVHREVAVDEEYCRATSPHLVALMLQTATIHASYLEVSVGGLRSLLVTRIKTFLRWLLRPVVKVTMVHQQELNHLLVLLAQSHLVLEKKVASLEARLAKAGENQG